MNSSVGLDCVDSGLTNFCLAVYVCVCVCVLQKAIRRREWMNPRKVFAHHIQQWSAASMRPIDCKFKTIKRAPEPGKPNGQEGHSVALYVNNFLVARAMGRTITAAQDAACSKALQLYGMKFT